MSSANVRKSVLGAASALEIAYDSDCLAVVDAAARFCDILKDSEVTLTTAEKMRVLKSVAKAKVRAFMAGPDDKYKMCKTLDAIISDLIHLL